MLSSIGLRSLHLFHLQCVRKEDAVPESRGEDPEQGGQHGMVPVPVRCDTAAEVGQSCMRGGLRKDGDGRWFGAGGHRCRHDCGLERQHVQLLAVLKSEWDSQVIDESFAGAIDLRAWPIEATDNGTDVQQRSAVARPRGVVEQKWERHVREDGGSGDIHGEQPAKGGGRNIGVAPVDGKADAVDGN